MRDFHSLARFSIVVICSVGVFASGAHVDTASKNKAVVRGYMEEILNKGNLAVFEEYFPSDGPLFNGQRFTAERVAAMVRVTRTAFPDFQVTIEDQIAEGDKVATRVTFRGTHKGEFRGVPPTDKQVSYSGIAIDRIAGGKVVEMWHEADTLGMLQQLGVVPKE
jgi:steroid delta-isomerase-like uncharacterized protein